MDNKRGPLENMKEWMKVLDANLRRKFLTSDKHLLALNARGKSVDYFDTRFQRLRILVRILEGFWEIPGIPKRFSSEFSGDSEDSDEIPKILTRFYKILDFSVRIQRFNPSKWHEIPAVIHSSQWATHLQLH